MTKEPDQETGSIDGLASELSTASEVGSLAHVAAVDGLSSAVAKVKALAAEIKVADYIHIIDREIILDHTEMLDKLDQSQVWEDDIPEKESRANPALYVLVDVQTFLDRYNGVFAHVTNRYLDDHYDKSNPDDARALNKIRELDIAMHALKDYLKEETRSLWTSPSSGIESPIKKTREYQNVVRGIRYNEIDRLHGLCRADATGQYAIDLDKIWRTGAEVIKGLRESPPRALITLRNLLDTFNEDHLQTHYANDSVSRKILEKMLVETRMMKTAVKYMIG